MENDLRTIYCLVTYNERILFFKLYLFCIIHTHKLCSPFQSYSLTDTHHSTLSPKKQSPWGYIESYFYILLYMRIHTLISQYFCFLIYKMAWQYMFIMFNILSFLFRFIILRHTYAFVDAYKSSSFSWTIIKYPSFWMLPSLSVHSSTGGRLGYFHFFIITDSTEIWTSLCRILCTPVTGYFLCYRPEREFLRHGVCSFGSKAVKKLEFENVSRTTKLILASVGWF